MRRKINTIVLNVLLIVLGLVTVYPFVWMLSSSFKQNKEIMALEQHLLPQIFTVKNYITMNARFNFMRFFFNSLLVTIVVTLAVIYTSTICGFVLSKYKFRGRNLLFGFVLSTMMIPWCVTIIPKYSMIQNFGWLDSYKPVIVPAIFATYPFFIYMMIQFIRGLPRELDESARIDGCGSFGIFAGIIVPLSKPAIFSVTLFQFVWRWNDFFNPLIYINSVSKYPVSLALRMSLDVADTVHWDQLMAMSLLTMLPPVLLYIFAQKYFIEGIATSGLKG